MNAKELLNRLAYPQPGDNAVRKTYPLYDTQAIATGVNEYLFFETAIGNQFLRNTRLPLPNEIFVCTGISAFLQQEINTTAEIDNLNELLQQAYLEIWNNSKRVCKLPLLDFLNYELSNNFAATGNAQSPTIIAGNENTDGFLGRKFSVPIVFNSNSSFRFRLRITTQSATDFNGINFRLYLYGYQIDKLMGEYWSELKPGEMFQEVPATFYETRAIPDANQTVFTLFQQGIADNLQSGFFPLSDIDLFSVEAMEFFVNQPDTPISPETIYNSRIQNVLRIKIDERDYWESVTGTLMTSMLAGFDVALTTTPDLTVTELLHVRKTLVLPIPLVIPANGKVNISIEQPGSSLGITGEFTLALRGTVTRRIS